MVNIIGEMYIILGEDNSGKQTLYWDTLYYGQGSRCKIS